MGLATSETAIIQPNKAFQDLLMEVFLQVILQIDIETTNPFVDHFLLNVIPGSFAPVPINLKLK
jgi:hypothetical protein